MDVQEIRNVRRVECMKGMIEVLKNAKRKKVFIDEKEFEELVMRIMLKDNTLKLDWDDGAGEEWARLSNETHGIVCMMNVRIGIVFIRKTYDYAKIKDEIEMLEIVFVDSYCVDDWYINLENLRLSIPEIYWHTSGDAVNVDAFSLDDFYFATI